ncbi:tyrosine phosphatase family-domain-containing protein [Dichotomocladium elegans]|nr:tyrosine phosphatase family-domain-containing protein [Dichotomocladium elegans]
MPAMSIQLPNLIPPFRYAIVEDKLLRGGYPKERNMRFLKRLRLKTILSLIPNKLTAEMHDFCAENAINMIHIKVDKYKEDNIPLSYNKTLMALQIIIDPANHPLYLHCLDGANVTGLVVACLRKLQMWSISSAMCDFSRFMHGTVISQEEFEFVENFKNFEVTIPSTIPSWLWGGHVSFRKHACLRLKFLNPEMMTEEEREQKERKEKMEREKEDFYIRRKNDLLDNLLDHGANTAAIRHRDMDTSKITTCTTSMDDLEFVPSSRIELAADRHENKDGRQLESPSGDRYLVDVDVDVDGVMMDGLDQVEYYNRLGHDQINPQDVYFGEDGEDGVLLVDETTGEAASISRMLEALALEGL